MRRPALLALAVGVVLLLVAGVVWWAAREPGTEGSEAAARLASASPTVAPSSAVPSPSATPGPASTIPLEPGTLPSADASVLPRRLTIPSIGVDAEVVPVALEARTDEMEVPQEVDIVGWYRFGPALDATAGSAVIAGHIDDAEQGLGAFARLRDVRPGNRLTVLGSDGRTRRYSVVAREVFVKTRVPLDRLFARDGALRLTLITCGGSFDRSARSYRDNIVVTAVEEAGR